MEWAKRSEQKSDSNVCTFKIKIPLDLHSDEEDERQEAEYFILLYYDR